MHVNNLPTSNYDVALAPSVPSTCMETDMAFSTEDVYGSSTLQKLAKQLQFSTPIGFRQVDKQFGEATGSKHEQKDSSSAEENDNLSFLNWRKTRAAVLICLFEGHEGELRVILTKRSMKLSSHPGNNYGFFYVSPHFRHVSLHFIICCKKQGM